MSQSNLTNPIGELWTDTIKEISTVVPKIESVLEILSTVDIASFCKLKGTLYFDQEYSSVLTDLAEVIAKLSCMRKPLLEKIAKCGIYTEGAKHDPN